MNRLNALRVSDVKILDMCVTRNTKKIVIICWIIPKTDNTFGCSIKHAFDFNRRPDMISNLNAELKCKLRTQSSLADSYLGRKSGIASTIGRPDDVQRWPDLL